MSEEDSEATLTGPGDQLQDLQDLQEDHSAEAQDYFKESYR